METIKDLRVVARLYNNQLRQRREALDMSGPQFAAYVGICYVSYVRLESLKEKPYGPRGWRRIALRIAEFYKEPVESLFPASVLAVERNETERRVDAEETAALLSAPAVTPIQLLTGAQDADVLYDSITGLGEQQRIVIALRYGLVDGDERTLQDVANVLGLSRERVRQVEAKALRKPRGKESPIALAQREGEL